MYCCSPDDITQFLDSEHANRLLSSDSIKVWILVARIEDGVDVFNSCLEDNTMTFDSSGSLDTLLVLGRVPDCSSSTTLDTLYQATYEIVANTNNKFENALELTKTEDMSLDTMSVDGLTSLRLIVTYPEELKTIQEYYTH